MSNSDIRVTEARTHSPRSFFTRVDRVLRRSLGVSEMAVTDTTVKPAPPVDPGLSLETSNEEPTVEDDGKVGVIIPDEMKDKVRFSMMSTCVTNAH